MTTTTTHPLDALPLTGHDRRFLVELLDLLPEVAISDYDFAEYVASPGGNNVYRHWDSAQSAPLIRYADRRPARRLEEFGWFEPIPSRQQVLDALEEAALAWEEELS